MAEMKDLYHVTKYVNSRQYAKMVLEKQKIGPLSLNDFIDDYRNHRWIIKLSKNKASTSVINAEGLGYIERFYYSEAAINDMKAVLDGKQTSINLSGGPENSVITFNVTSKGLHLLGKKFFLFRVGLWDESLKHYDKSHTILLGIVIAIISACGGALVTHIYP